MEHSFDVELAKKYGLEEAILIKHFVFWIQKNKANGKHYHDGKIWTYNSTAAFAEIFPYLSYKQIRRVLDSLKNQNVIVVGNHNENKYDQTLWYAFFDESEFLFSQLPKRETSNCPNGQMEAPKWANRTAQMGRPIPDTNTYNNTDIAGESEIFSEKVFAEVRRQTPTGNWHWQKAFSKKIAGTYNPKDVKNLTKIVETWIEKELNRVR